MKNGFVKVAAAVPKLRVADPSYNVDELIRIAKKAAKNEVRVLVFPELCITGYTCADLFETETLLSAAKLALEKYLKKTASLDLLSVVGLPYERDQKLYDCAAVCKGGSLLALVPKVNLCNYGDSYELRWFTPAPQALEFIECFGGMTAFGTEITLNAYDMPGFSVAVEVGGDALASCPPSARHTAAGATIICNPCAMLETVGSREYRRMMFSSLSAREVTGYLSVSCGVGESTTDGVFGGQSLIFENGVSLSESEPFDSKELFISEIDTELLCRERRRKNTYRAALPESHQQIPFSVEISNTELSRFVDPHPFIPSDLPELQKRCELILNVQAHGLKARIERAYAKRAVIGISGGLDSTLALLVAVRAMDLLNRPHTDVVAVTMPCFGTTRRTRDNATILCEELGVDFRCVDIKKAVDQHFSDIGHDPSIHDVTYENSQARERTQILMDIANECGGMVIGTGDLSELALGWATYNGDHMSMYGVNASIPKTLVRQLVSYYADYGTKNNRLAQSLRDVLDTPVSPELLPADETGKIAQKTEDLVGPYELHDFFLYHFVRRGESPKKIFRLAKTAFADAYDDTTLLKWLEIFFRRFFSQQFKRSCLPDGPAVGSVSLSPRGSWKMPSDAVASAWMLEIEDLKK